MGIAPVVYAPPLPLVEICFIFEYDAISMIEIDLPSTPTHDVQAAGDKKISNCLITDEKLLDNVDLSDKQGINR